MANKDNGARKAAVEVEVDGVLARLNGEGLGNWMRSQGLSNVTLAIALGVPVRAIVAIRAEGSPIPLALARGLTRLVRGYVGGDFRAFQDRHGLTDAEAAKALGQSADDWKRTLAGSVAPGHAVNLARAEVEEVLA